MIKSARVFSLLLAASVGALDSSFAVCAEPGKFIVTEFEKFAPNFAHPDNARGPLVTTIADGDWTNAGVWDPRIPQSGDVAVIKHAVRFNTQTQVQDVVIYPNGRLDFESGMNTRLRTSTLQVLECGTLTVGTTANKISTSNTAEIIFANQPINTSVDPGRYGHGLFAVGKVHMHGADKTPFVRLTRAPRSGDATLSLAQAVSGWQPGDRLLLPSTKQLVQGEVPADREEFVLASVSGLTATLQSAVQFDHPGSANRNGVVDVFPAVANLTRNILIHSEDPHGERGHAIFQQQADVDIRYAQFEDLGRTTDNGLNSTIFDANGNPTRIGTNQKGRYAVHFHHLRGPATTPANGYQYTFVGNSVAASTKWGITVHDSFYGLITDNVVTDAMGGLVMFEGNDHFNFFARNYLAGPVHHVFTGRGDERAGAASEFDFGWEGSSLWSGSPNNIYRDNLFFQGTEKNYAVTFLPTAATASVPRFKGAILPGDFDSIETIRLPIKEFSGNEICGGRSGLTIWNVGVGGATDPVEIGETLIKDLLIWNVWHDAFFPYPIKNFTFENFRVRGAGRSWPSAFFGGDYLTENLRIRNSEFLRVGTGFFLMVKSGDSRSTGDRMLYSVIEDSYIEAIVNIHTEVPGAVTGGGANLAPNTLYLKNVRMSHPANIPQGFTPRNFDREYRLAVPNINLIKKDFVCVQNHQGVAGDNFQVYMEEQAPGFILPQTAPGILGSPEAGLTNQQNWNKYGIAMGGAVAPCSTTEAQARGFICRSNVQCDFSNENIGNLAPVVLDLPDLVLASPGFVDVAAEVSDDRMPSGSSLSLSWTKVTGPAGLSFSNPTGASTRITLPSAGRYVVRFRASDGALSTAKDFSISVAVPAPAQQLKALFAMDEDEGTTAVNAWNDRHGYYVNDVVPSPDAAPLQAANPRSRYFNGANYIFASDSVQTDALTASLWINFTGNPASRNILHRSRHNEFFVSNLRLFTNPDGTLAVMVHDGSIKTVTGTTKPQKNHWTHVAFTYQKNGFLKLYANGAEEGTAQSVGAVAANTSGFYAGTSAGANNEYSYFHGKMDELRIYDRPLSAQEISDLANGGGEAAGNKPPAVTAAANPAMILLTGTSGLDGTVTDDGLPASPGRVTYLWEKVSGPGSVILGNAAAVDTTARFSELGTYVLKLTATDGELADFSNVTVNVVDRITVNQAPTVRFDTNTRAATVNRPLTLSALVTDDGLPEPVALTTRWTVESGPGAVDFLNAADVDTTATFRKAGTYSIKLDASDGLLSGSDLLTVTASDGPGAPGGPNGNDNPSGQSPLRGSSVLDFSKGQTQLPIPAPGPGEVLILDRDHHVIRRLNTFFQNGEHAAIWDGRTDKGPMAAAGYYTAWMSMDGRRTSKGLVLIK